MIKIGLTVVLHRLLLLGNDHFTAIYVIKYIYIYNRFIFALEDVQHQPFESDFTCTDVLPW